MPAIAPPLLPAEPVLPVLVVPELVPPVAVLPVDPVLPVLLVLPVMLPVDPLRLLVEALPAEPDPACKQP